MPEEKPDLLRDLQRTCRKLEAAIQQCERLLQASPLVVRPEDVPVAPVGDQHAQAEAGPLQKVER